MSSQPPVLAEYLSIGGNRHSAAADWSSSSSIFAYGADQNVALWHPLPKTSQGVFALLTGHVAQVTAVKFLSPSDSLSAELILSGSADGEIKVWKNEAERSGWVCISSKSAHQGAVNVLQTLAGTSIVVSGGADMTVKIWRWDEHDLQHLAKVQLQPRLIPLTIVLGALPESEPSERCFMAVGGTRNDIQIYSIDQLPTNPVVKTSAILTGHEGWIRSLALTLSSDGSQLLASTSHDKYIRLWRFQATTSSNQKRPTQSNGIADMIPTLSAKVQEVGVNDSKYAITFEALLLGHEDWVYSARWNPSSQIPQLLTASADGSLAVWEPDPDSGIWLSTSRLGEISGQKGATTATGSAGGFWAGLWSPDGKAITCLGRTGSWRVWTLSDTSQTWEQIPGVSGHVGSVNGLSWSPCGGYVVSTSSDQTTRLHARYTNKSNKRSWHEFARPQIHGYDLNCVVCTNRHQLCSGADEKLLRVFNEPKPMAVMLENLAGVHRDDDSSLAATAAMPVLGLSNKSIDNDEQEMDMNGLGYGKEAEYVPMDPHVTLQDLTSPPTEDLLSRHTLWPEHEKLYGHGYEISECAVSSDGTILATACKASSIDHAVIRLYDTRDWHEIKPPLSAHSLTVTRLTFSPDGLYLLSVGRDRQWTVFQRTTETDVRHWQQIASNPKAHSRMILDAAWLPSSTGTCFVTAGRDKNVKFWTLRAEQNSQTEFGASISIAKKSPVTTVAFSPAQPAWTTSMLAIGEDSGAISIHFIDLEIGTEVGKMYAVPSGMCPSKTINRMAWRPVGDEDEGRQRDDLAVASADGSFRILGVDSALMHS